jgi:hypothetical protein
MTASSPTDPLVVVGEAFLRNDVLERLIIVAMNKDGAGPNSKRG